MRLPTVVQWSLPLVTNPGEHSAGSSHLQAVSEVLLTHPEPSRRRAAHLSFWQQRDEACKVLKGDAVLVGAVQQVHHALAILLPGWQPCSLEHAHLRKCREFKSLHEQAACLFAVEAVGAVQQVHHCLQFSCLAGSPARLSTCTCTAQPCDGERTSGFCNTCLQR